MTPLGTDLEHLEGCTAQLLVTADSLEELDAPTLCEGWTRAHVLTHVARNADAIARLVDSAVTGKAQEMYPGGPPRRDADVEEGAGRGRAEILADLRDSAARVADRLAVLDGPLASPEVEMRGGVMAPAGRLPFLRLREVAFHHVDLAAGYTFADVDQELLKRLIDNAVRRLQQTPAAPSLKLGSDQGDVWSIGDGAAYVTGSRAGILLWLARRVPTQVHADSLPDLPRGN